MKPLTSHMKIHKNFTPQIAGAGQLFSYNVNYVQIETPKQMLDRALNFLLYRAANPVPFRCFSDPRIFLRP